jgi:hypothetical protein
LIDGAPLRHRLEDVGEPKHRFRRAKHQKAIRFDRLGKPVQHIGLGLLIEVDQYVPAEDQVEHPELGEVVQQVELPVLNHRADVGIDLPELSRLLEVLEQHLDREAALDFELTVKPRFGFFERLLGEVGRYDFDAPAGERRAASFMLIASEYGSWPVEPAAHQIRIRLRLARARRICGMIRSRK